METLEPRTVLANGLVISELVADNNWNLQDFDDDWSDWIEVLNPTSSPVNIHGFYLTDDVGDLTKWQVPVDRLIDPAKRLVLFASGKDYVAPNGELHTNFRLGVNGEYLALVEPDGVTIASQFHSPLPDGRLGYPEQFEDVSYGIALRSHTVELLSPEADIEYLVPTSAEQLNADWNQPDFNDPEAVWTASPAGNGLGFDTGEEDTEGEAVLLGHWPLDEVEGQTVIDSSGQGNDGTVVGATFVPAGGQYGGALRFNGDTSHADLGGDASTFSPSDEITVAGWVRLSSDQPAFFQSPTIAAKGDTQSFAFWLTVTAQKLRLQMPNAEGSITQAEDSGQLLVSDGWTHVAFTAVASQGEDTGDIRLYKQGQPVATVAYDVPSLPASDGSLILGQNGDLLPGFGLDGLLDEFAIWDRALSNEDIALLAADSTPAELSLPSHEDFSDLIATDVESPMHGVNASVFMRAAFDVTDPSVLEEPTLGIRYDDGFVAYLNGIEIARRNAPAATLWNSSATGPHPDHEAIRIAKIPLRAGKLLRDFNSTSEGTFLVDMPNGVYDVAISHGDILRVRDEMDLFLEGLHVDSVRTEAGEYVTNIYRVVVEDQQLTLRIQDLGGVTGRSIISALAITSVDESRDPLQFDFGTATSSLRAGAIRIDDLTAYSAELGYGWSPGSIGANSRDIDSDGADLLQSGRNVLAIHGLNLDANQADFLIETSLTATQESVDTSRTLYFDHPTPGQENIGGAPQVAAPPQFSVAGGTFSEDLVLELTTDIPGGTIHFTTDETLPTPSSDIYDPLAAIPITGSTQIRAIVAATDHLVSSVVTQTYIELGEDVRAFTSRLPLMILDNFGDQRFKPRDQKMAYWAIFEPQDEDGQSSLLNAPELETRAGVKTRGNSSIEWPKKSFAIEAWDEKDQDRDISPLGMSSESDWILSARYRHDRALMRNPFSFELSNRTGRYAVRTRFVEVFVNTDGSELDASDYVGVYTLMEKIKRDANRVDVEKLSKNYDSEPLIGGGYILKIDGSPDPGDGGFVAGGERLLYVEPKEVEIKASERQTQDQFIRAYVNDAAASLNNTNPETGFPSYIDVDSWIDFHLLNNLTKNPDAFRVSTFLFKTREGKLEYGPIWDFNVTIGGDADRDRQPTGWEPEQQSWHFNYLWWGTLFSHRDFRQKYADRYQELREGPWRTSNMDAIIFSLAAQITDDAADRNFEKWSEVRPDSGSPPSWLGEVERMRSWLERRVDWIDDQLIPKPILTPTPQTQAPTPGGLPPGSLVFDFGPPESSVADGYLGWGGEPFDPNLGYGWTSGSSELVDRGNGGKLQADFAAIAAPSGIFSVELDNGRYDVTIVAGDHDQIRDEMQFRLEPGTANETGDLVTTIQGRFLEKTYQVEVEDGRLDLEVSDLGGVSGRAVINSLIITPFDSEEDVVPAGSTFTLSLPDNAPQGTKLFYTLNGPDPRISILDGNLLPMTVLRDFNATADGTFLVDLPNGTYDVTIHSGDLERDRDEGVIFLEGEQVHVEPIDVLRGEFFSDTYQVTVSDGQLSLVLQDLGGETVNFPLNHLEISGAGSPETILFDFGTSTSPVEEDYSQVPNDLSYSTDRGFGWASGTIHGQSRQAISRAGAISPWAIEYQSETISITDTTIIRARAFLPNSTRHISDSASLTIDWSGMIEQTFNVEKPQLAVTEIHYHPSDPSEEELAVNADLSASDFEFIELKNVGSSSVNLNNFHFGSGVDFSFPSATLEAGQYALIVSDQQAFQQRYSPNENIVGDFTGRLSNAGEDLSLLNAAGDLVFELAYDDNDPWPERADGAGASLELIDPDGTAVTELGKPYHWRASTQFGGSPGEANADPVGVVINEVVSRDTDPPSQPDAIELFNTTDAPIGIGGWFLSDSVRDLLKSPIPAGTTLAAGGYAVITQQQFNPTPENPLPHHFGLSGTNGDDVWLVQADGFGKVTRFVDDVHFGAAAPGESIGRIPDGEGRLVPMESVTLGGANSGARVGPVVFSEIHYHPGEPTPEVLAIVPELDSNDLEFFEVHNPTEDRVDLTGWQVRGGIEFNFADGMTIGPGETLVVISFNPNNPANVDRLAAFRQYYDLEETVPLLGGYTGRLSNSHDLLRLLRLGNPPQDDPASMSHLLEDEVLYDDLPPWPTSPDGMGRSLARTDKQRDGNQATSWTAQSPTPTLAVFTQLGDLDRDGDVDFDDIDDFLLAMNDPEAYQSRYSVSHLLAGDINQDGTIDQVDINELVKILSG